MTTWNTYLTALKNYTERENTTRVPSDVIELVDETPVRLGPWTTYIRLKQRSGALPDSKRAEVESVVPGFEWGPFKPGPRADQSRLARIYTLRDKGLSMTKIGNELGVTRQRVSQILKEHG